MAPQPEADLVVAMGAVGTVITYSVLGSGFVAGEVVSIVLLKADAAGANIDLGSATANDSGAFELAVDSAKLTGLAAGVYSAKATGDQGSVASAPLKIK